MVKTAFLKYQTGQGGDLLGGREKKRANVGSYFSNPGRR